MWEMTSIKNRNLSKEIFRASEVLNVWLVSVFDNDGKIVGGIEVILISEDSAFKFNFLAWVPLWGDEEWNTISTVWDETSGVASLSEDISWSFPRKGENDSWTSNQDTKKLINVPASPYAASAGLTRRARKEAPARSARDALLETASSEISALQVKVAALKLTFWEEATFALRPKKELFRVTLEVAIVFSLADSVTTMSEAVYQGVCQEHKIVDKRIVPYGIAGSASVALLSALPSFWSLPYALASLLEIAGANKANICNFCEIWTFPAFRYNQHSFS